MENIYYVLVGGGGGLLLSGGGDQGKYLRAKPAKSGYRGISDHTNTHLVCVYIYRHIHTYTNTHIHRISGISGVQASEIPRACPPVPLHVLTEARRLEVHRLI